jgi:hypothetical protein
LDKDSIASEKQYEYATADAQGMVTFATMQNMLRGKEITGSNERALVSTSLDIDTSSVSSASTSPASTPAPSTISSLFAKSTVNVKEAVVPAELVVPPVTVSNLSLGEASENREM